MNLDKKIFIILFLFLVPIFCLASAQSSNYLIEQDSINIGGLEKSSSTNYSARDTIGEAIVGRTSSANYQDDAGFRQISDDGYLTISSESDSITMPEVSAFFLISSSSNAWNVKTNLDAGYNLQIRAITSPAMKSASSSIPDYVPTSTNPSDYEWIASSASRFGFTVYTNDGNLSSQYKHDGSQCGPGGTQYSVRNCWDGFSTINKEIVNRSTKTGSDLLNDFGENVQIDFQVEIASGQMVGDYRADLIITLVPN